MIPRYSGAVLGFLAFGVATVTGVICGNPPEVVLGRALWALVVFCMVGLVVGAAGQAVANEFERRREAESLGPPAAAGPGPGESEVTSPAPAKPLG
jgi:hypothetical protein